MKHYIDQVLFQVCQHPGLEACIFIEVVQALSFDTKIKYVKKQAQNSWTVIDSHLRLFLQSLQDVYIRSK